MITYVLYGFQSRGGEKQVLSIVRTASPMAFSIRFGVSLAQDQDGFEVLLPSYKLAAELLRARGARVEEDEGRQVDMEYIKLRALTKMLLVPTACVE